MKRSTTIVIALFFALVANAQQPYAEKFRPQFHFTPPKNWINDPNGLVYFDGEYHLFYQHNPFENIWGHMSWGHAVSKDLVYWEHLPVALPEEDGIMIFSGCVVVDSSNTSGFAEKNNQIPLVAIYTGYTPGKNQAQHIAYSLDKGRTWRKYSANPVLDLNEKEFRDPNVFWYAPQKKWVMAVVLALQRKVQLYSSANLKQWKYMSSFGPAGDTTGVWECPDLFEAPVKGIPGESKWVLMHSPAPYMQYFVGEFDGTTFKNENPPTKIFRPDYGPDYYAAIVYDNLPPDQAPVSIAWINNWDYANQIPTSPWKGVMSIPRSLSVQEENGEWALISEPIDKLKTLRESPLSMIPVTTKTSVDLMQVKGPSEILCELSVSENATGGLKLSSKNLEEVRMGYNAATKEFFIDRSKSDTFSNAAYRKLSHFTAPIQNTNRRIPIHVFYDESVITVFVNEGEVCFTFQVFPEHNYDRLSLFAENGEAKLNRTKLWALKSIWKK